MKNGRLLNALEQVDEKFITASAPENTKKTKKAQSNAWMKWGVLAACAVVIVAVGVPQVFRDKGISGGKPETEGNISDVTSDEGLQNEAGEGETNLDTMAHMAEIKIKIDEMFPDGFRGTIEVGTDLFKEGEQITIVAQDNVTIVQQDGSIFAYDELEPNIPDSDLAIGYSVWVGFQKYDYVEGNGKYNQIFAYHIGGNRDDMDMNYGETVPDSASELVVNVVKEPINIALPNLREDIRTPMTNKELYEYYDTDFADALNKVAVFEERESDMSIPKGIYTYADGSVFDMNGFIYYQAEMDYELCVTIGRSTRCSQLIINMYEDAQSSEINGIDVVVFKTESENETIYYAVFELGECDYIISGTNIEEDVFEKILGTITR